MKIRSKPLYQFLLLANVLNGSNESIALAKKAYRKEYKKGWRRKARPQKEVRFNITIRQFQALKAKAWHLGLRHTTYVKSLALASIDQPCVFDDKPLEILQLVSMAIIALSNGANVAKANDLLEKAEISLLKYLNMPFKNHENEK